MDERERADSGGVGSAGTGTTASAPGAGRSRWRLRTAVVVFAVLSTLAGFVAPVAASRADEPSRGCRGVAEATGGRADSTSISGAHLRHCLRINQIQVIGSHNSYKQPVTPGIFEALLAFDRPLAESLEYSHLTFAEQFSTQGVRQIELDIFADPEGGHLAGRVLLDALELPNETPPELLEPGFKTLHAQEVDFNSHCLRFVDCLQQIEDWSRANRGHLPITVLVELKTSTIPDPLNLGFVEPLPIGPAELDALDAEIRSIFEPHQMITPDRVRGGYDTLEAAVLAGNWPTLQRARGDVMFVMDNGGQTRLDYLDGHPSLEGRVLFTNAAPGDDDAAFVKVNNPLGNEAYIQGLVADGYVVRTRADSPTDQARTGDTAQRDAALASGAQWVSTDYPVPGSSPFSDYYAAIPDGDPARCNPVNTGPRCANAGLERLFVQQRST